MGERDGFHMESRALLCRLEPMLSPRSNLGVRPLSELLLPVLPRDRAASSARNTP